jgi:hypothetical protein
LTGKKSHDGKRQFRETTTMMMMMKARRRGMERGVNKTRKENE